MLSKSLKISFYRHCSDAVQNVVVKKEEYKGVMVLPMNKKKNKMRKKKNIGV